MDKNIAALLREDTRTVAVVFDQIAKDFDSIDDSIDDDIDYTAVPPRRTSPGAPQPQKRPDAKAYTYVTDMQLGIGDTVIVEARGLLTLAWVRRVDDDVKIEPNSDTTYKWVVAKVDMANYQQNLARNEEIERTVAEAYRNNMRRSFAQQILAGVDDAHRDGLAKLLGKS